MRSMITSRIAPTFADGASKALIQALDIEPHAAYAIDRGWNIVYVNPAWSDFSAANGGKASPELGTSVWDVIPTILRVYYRQGVEGAMDAGEPWEHHYECSSDTLFRRFRMRVLPLPGKDFAVFTNDLAREAPMNGGHAQPDARYVSADTGLMIQCANCRRLLRVGDRPEWDWVSTYVRSPPARVSHGLCTVCLEFHYPDSPSPRR